MLTPDGAALLANGREIREPLYIRQGLRPREADEKTPRGLLLRVHDVSFWDECQNCFVSIPARDLASR